MTKAVPRASLLALGLSVTLFGCVTDAEQSDGLQAPAPIRAAVEGPEGSDDAAGPAIEPLEDPSISAAAPRPDWLGTRALPLAPDGFGQRLPTPDELVDRRLVTPRLPDPAPPAPMDERFEASILDVPPAVLERSTWTPECPVGIDQLRYLVIQHFGFDGRVHAGELIVHRDVAVDVVEVFAALHAARFPLEEVRVIARDELSLPATGDGNVTSAFVCRPVVSGRRWSEHAYGLAIDLNPFHNPYVRGDLVIPELAGAYTDRSHVRPGMIIAGDAVTEAFASIGWGWGGDWTGGATDPMHFSRSGR